MWQRHNASMDHWFNYFKNVLGNPTQNNIRDNECQFQNNYTQFHSVSDVECEDMNRVIAEEEMKEATKSLKMGKARD